MKNNSVLFLFCSLSASFANDNFSDAIELNGSFSTSQASSVGATSQTGEPDYTINDTSFNSLWWKWTAPSNGTLSVDLIGSQLRFGSSSFGKILGSFVSGPNVLAVDNLFFIASSGSSTNEEPKLQFPVSAGTEYFFHACSYSSNEKGDIKINLSLDTNDSFSQLPLQGLSSFTNDNFADASPLAGPSASGLSYTRGASIESGEPDFLGQNTVWWKWIAPTSGRLLISTTGSASRDGSSSWAKRIAVFQGDSLTSLRYCAIGGGTLPSLDMPVATGNIYHIALGSEDDEGGYAVLNLLLNSDADLSGLNLGDRAHSANDLFTNRVKLRGGNISAIGYGIGGTREAFEPDFSGGGSLWWTYKPASDGTVQFSTIGSDLTQNRLLSLWTGDTLAGLELVGSSDFAVRPSASFEVSAGEAYQVSLGASNLSSQVGTIVLSMNGPVSTKDFLVDNLTIENAIRLRWPTDAGQVYQVRNSATLEDFSELGPTILGDGSEADLLLPIIEGKSFFEVVEE